MENKVLSGQDEIEEREGSSDEEVDNDEDGSDG